MSNPYGFQSARDRATFFSSFSSIKNPVAILKHSFVKRLHDRLPQAYQTDSTLWLFLILLQHCWEENDNSDVEINQFTYPVYKAFLNYLYCDEVTLMPDDAIGLLDLANSYCEANLKRRCEELIMQGITVENAAMLYATAIKYLAKDLEEFCFKFCLNHMTAVTQTEAFQKLDDELCKMFIAKAAQNGAFKS